MVRRHRWAPYVRARESDQICPCQWRHSQAKLPELPGAVSTNAVNDYFVKANYPSEGPVALCLSPFPFLRRGTYVRCLGVLFSMFVLLLAAAATTAWGQATAPSGSVAHESTGKLYYYVGGDEFSPPSVASSSSSSPPNGTLWTNDIGYIANNEKQCYTSSATNAFLTDDGKLAIVARKETSTVCAGFAYTSARVVSRGRFHVSEGTWIIVRAKLPLGRGTWPAIWLFPVSETPAWPYGGEIDIMEAVGHDWNAVFHSVHTGTHNADLGNGRTRRVNMPKLEADYHTYELRWRKGFLDFLVDGALTFVANKTDGGDWPFEAQTPFYILLNMAIGGSWGGEKGIDDTIFPVTTLFDYVRVYAEEGNGQVMDPYPAGMVTASSDFKLSRCDTVPQGYQLATAFQSQSRFFAAFADSLVQASTCDGSNILIDAGQYMYVKPGGAANDVVAVAKGTNTFSLRTRSGVAVTEVAELRGWKGTLSGSNASRCCLVVTDTPHVNPISTSPAPPVSLTVAPPGTSTSPSTNSPATLPLFVLAPWSDTSTSTMMAAASLSQVKGAAFAPFASNISVRVGCNGDYVFLSSGLYLYLEPGSKPNDITALALSGGSNGASSQVSTTTGMLSSTSFASLRRRSDAGVIPDISLLKEWTPEAGLTPSGYCTVFAALSSPPTPSSSNAPSSSSPSPPLFSSAAAVCSGAFVLLLLWMGSDASWWS